MNRLQVGGECYVRVVRSGIILKVMYGDLTAALISGSRNEYRIVYPFPCIKELAI